MTLCTVRVRICDALLMPDTAIELWQGLITRSSWETKQILVSIYVLEGTECSKSNDFHHPLDYVYQKGRDNQFLGNHE